MAREINFDDLSPELKDKLASCESPDDYAKLAKSVGIELTEEELDSISGGGIWGGGCKKSAEKYRKAE